MRKLLFVGVGILFILTIVPFRVGAEESRESVILVSEIQTGSTESASHEFVELYNPTDNLIALKNYNLEYKSATGESWFNKVTFEDGEVIQPRGYFLISSFETYERIDINQSLRLAGSGGHVRLVAARNETKQVIDTVGWGTADSAESSSAPAPGKDESISRSFDRYGTMIDTDNNAEDFHVLTLPKPESTTPLDEANNDGDISREINYSSVEITELLIDPEMPLTDNEDEFIELYNPHAMAVDMAGYVIKTGMQFRYSYEIESLEIQPHTYHVMKAEDTGLTLANTQGRAAIFSPDDELLFETAEYRDAETGSSWNKFESGWRWSSRKTAGATNRMETDEALDSQDSGQENEAGDEPDRTVFPELRITELMIDPVAPKTDSNDEYVELFNPNEFQVDTAEFVIKTGLPLRYKETLESISLKPGEYRAFYASETGLTLSNMDGVAALFGNGSELHRTKAYESAPPGAAWAYIDGNWKFTYQPTPNEENILLKKDTGSVLSSEAQASESEQMTDSEVINTVTEPAALPSSEYGGIMVVGVVGLAILYMLYEFRYDIRNRIELTRRYFATRGEARE